MNKKMSWYWNRLRCMSVFEIGYRIHKTLSTEAQRLGLFLAREVPLANLSLAGNNFIHGLKSIPGDLYCRATSDILKGKVSIFALDYINQEALPNWNRDPLTGKVAPLAFGKKLDYRDPALVGDIKYLWEPNRLHHLVTLAQAYHLTNDQRYLYAIEAQLSSWFKQCPYPLGPNWTSSLELGIRLINWSVVWQLIGGKDCSLFTGNKGTEFLQQWLEVIYRHAHFIRWHFSRYSSANNHLIGEVAGLFIATTTWPYWDNFTGWNKLAKATLEKEALLQNSPDGVNREQAISYQQFVLDFLIISGLAGRANNADFSETYWKRIEAMLEYLASVMDVAGNVPMIGDADDGFVVRLAIEESWCPYKSLLTTGAILFNRGDFKIKGGGLDTKTLWLTGEEAAEKYHEIETERAVLPVRREFPEGGYYILGCGLETKSEIRVLVDAGPLGYQGIAAHGHADALALTLSVAGVEFLIDPGTYAYHTQQKWRNYFRGTSAHNTIRIDGQDQSISGGNFMWLHKANAWCEVWESNEEMDYFVGAHDGYARFHDPVTHRREIKLDKLNRKIIVTDIILCKDHHTVECYWNFAETCDVKVNGRVIDVVNQGRNIALVINDDDSTIDAFKGDAAKPIGWISRRFDVKVPSVTVVRKVLAKGDTVLVTEIFCGDA